MTARVSSTGGIQWRSSVLIAIPKSGSALAKSTFSNVLLRTDMGMLCDKSDHGEPRLLALQEHMAIHAGMCDK